MFILFYFTSNIQEQSWLLISSPEWCENYLQINYLLEAFVQTPLIMFFCIFIFKYVVALIFLPPNLWIKNVLSACGYFFFYQLGCMCNRRSITKGKLFFDPFNCLLFNILVNDTLLANLWNSLGLLYARENDFNNQINM
jgi:hypothetical protein